MKDKLTKEQSAHLIELGVSAEKASAGDFCVAYGNGARGIMKTPAAPIFTLVDVLELLPKEIAGEKSARCLEIICIKDKDTSVDIWYPVYADKSGSIYVDIPFIQSKELIDALYELLCWTIKNKYLKI